jgi:hypothetical protein
MDQKNVDVAKQAGINARFYQDPENLKKETLSLLSERA